MATPDRLGTSQLHVPPGFIDIETDDIGTPQRIAYRVAEDVVDARSPGQALCRKLTFPCADAGEAKSLFVEACANLSGRRRNSVACFAFHRQSNGISGLCRCRVNEFYIAAYDRDKAPT